MTKINRIYLILLSAVYLLLTVGFGIRAHYCHGDLSSITYVTVSPDCDCGDEDAEMSCCTTIDQYFQFTEVGLISDKKEKISCPIAFAEVLCFECIEESQEIVKIGITSVENGSPPKKYILHSSLILYS